MINPDDIYDKVELFSQSIKTTSTLMSEIRDTLTDYAKDPDSHLLIRNVLFMEPDLVDTISLKQIYKISVFDLFRKWPIRARCIGCSCLIDYSPKSKAELRDYQNGNVDADFYCKSCRNEIVTFDLPEGWEQNFHINYLRKLPYEEYLKTGHWKFVRSRAVEYADKSCQLCKSKLHINVHHNTYERRGCESLNDLIVLCRECHSKFHDQVTGK